MNLDQESVENEYNLRSMSPISLNEKYRLRGNDPYSLIADKVNDGSRNRQIKTSRYSNEFLNTDLWVIFIY